MTPTLLFSDVDGTLLDSSGRYAMTASDLAPHLQRLTVVLASSRTLLELSGNQRALGLSGPVVAENGAVVGLPWHEGLASWGERETIDRREWFVIRLGADATDIRRAIAHESAALRIAYLDQADIEPGLDRRCSVLLRPVGATAAEALAPLAERLRSLGFSASSGGSWLAVTGGADKGTGARMVLAYQRAFQALPDQVAAVGDGDNDVALLLAADRRFVVARDDGGWHEALRELGGVVCLATPGVAGWRDVITQLSDSEED